MEDRTCAPKQSPPRDYSAPKVMSSAEEAIADVQDGATIAIPGFFVAGVPRALLRALIAKGTKNLVLTCGCGPLVGSSAEMDALIENHQIRKIVDSYPFYRSASKGRDSSVERAVRSGELEVEVIPMGTLAEKYRAAAAGLPAFYTPVGVGTVAAAGRETKRFGDQDAILELALRPDFAFIHAYRGDRFGNLSYRRTATNFNPIMAAAAEVTIAEVETLVEVGELPPEMIRTPGVHVRRVVEVGRAKVPIVFG